MKTSKIFQLLFFLVFTAGCNDIPKEIRETVLFKDVTKKSLDIVSIGYSFNEPQPISGIAVHARNDGNHIIAGDLYELMVYDHGWKSLGLKEAIRQEITFDSIPEGGLFWLKNLSRGSEELPFMFDAEGNQFWVGQYYQN